MQRDMLATHLLFQTKFKSFDDGREINGKIIADLAESLVEFVNSNENDEVFNITNAFTLAREN